jgi:hypothetical protein
MKMFKSVFTSIRKNFVSSELSIRIEKDGWVVINHYSGELLSLIKNICSNLELDISFYNYKKLIPKDSKDVQYFSLSSAYGLNKFPLHTDGTEYNIPPRFIILRALADSSTGTSFADSNSIKDNVNICNTEWSVKTKDGILQTKLFAQHPKYNIEYIRFNRLSMKCVDGNRLEVNNAIDNLSVSYIYWKQYKTIIIDNWRVLHGRQMIIEEFYDKRIIERLQVFI